ncbi:hypothetical protein E2C01_098095 [Portunus trituberculatus]|uniref:Uncharacterized protein n=1 Tax=Portunus trituberculatus TaxID=210409 RepID=A0A5B7K7H0_PORTR|nr:hypothetical protein [Portunus trituberculatus]
MERSGAGRRVLWRGGACGEAAAGAGFCSAVPGGLTSWPGSRYPLIFTSFITAPPLAALRQGVNPR